MKVWCQCVILLTIFESVVAFTVISTFYEIPRHCGGAQVNDSYKYSSFEARSNIHCSMACHKDPKCYSFIYHHQQCQLFDMILLNDCSTAAVKTRQFYFEKAGCLNGGHEKSTKNCQCIDGYIAEKCYRLMYDCKEGFGVYPQHDLRLLIKPSRTVEPFRVHCQMRWGGRSYILCHLLAQTSLNQSWSDYQRGFGSLYSDHWLGLDHLSSIVNGRAARGKTAQLTFETKAGAVQMSEYHSNFIIGNETEDYKIKSVGSYTGQLSDCMTDLIGSTFATYDHGSTDRMSCAVQYGGGWWFGNACARCNPVGTVSPDGMRLNVTSEKFWPGVVSSLSRIKIWIG